MPESRTARISRHMRELWNLIGVFGASAGAGGLVVFLILGLSLADEDIRRGIEISILLALVTITAVSVNATVRIASRATNQAQATQALAESAQRQLHSGFRPIVRFPARVQLKPVAVLDVENSGLGPALNVRCWLEIKLRSGSTQLMNKEGHRHFAVTLLPAGQTQRSLGQGSWNVRTETDPGDTEYVSYVAVYRDVYENVFKSESRAENSRGELEYSEFTTESISTDEARELLRQAGYAVGP